MRLKHKPNNEQAPRDREPGVSAKPSVSSTTQGLTTLAEQSSMGLTTLVAPLQEAVTEKLFSGWSPAPSRQRPSPTNWCEPPRTEPRSFPNGAKRATVYCCKGSICEAASRRSCKRDEAC